jgi:hypothetical protein
MIVLMMPTLRLEYIRALFLRLPLQCCCTADAADESSAGQRIAHAHAQFKCIDSRTFCFFEALAATAFYCHFVHALGRRSRRPPHPMIAPNHR